MRVYHLSYTPKETSVRRDKAHRRGSIGYVGRNETGPYPYPVEQCLDLAEFKTTYFD
jgi:hypothetical protein